MNGQKRRADSRRPVLVCFPDFEIRYRFTDEVHAIGDSLTHNGETLVVSCIEDAPLGGVQQVITCRKSEEAQSAEA